MSIKKEMLRFFRLIKQKGISKAITQTIDEFKTLYDLDYFKY